MLSKSAVQLFLTDCFKRIIASVLILWSTKIFALTSRKSDVPPESSIVASAPILALRALFRSCSRFFERIKPAFVFSFSKRFRHRLPQVYTNAYMKGEE